MFLRLTTTKSETLVLNVSKVLFFGQSKGKACVVMEDGNVFELRESLQDIESQLNPLSCESDK